MLESEWLPFVLKGLAILAWIKVTGDTNNVQDVYADGGRGGLLSLVLSTVFIAVFSPLGEELLYRGIVTNALLRYGPFVGVVGSTVIFALMHGINNIFPRCCGGRSRHRRGLSPQWIDLARSRRPRCFQPALLPDHGVHQRGIIERIIWRLNQWQF